MSRSPIRPYEVGDVLLGGTNEVRYWDEAIVTDARDQNRIHLVVTKAASRRLRCNLPRGASQTRDADVLNRHYKLIPATPTPTTIKENQVHTTTIEIPQPDIVVPVAVGDVFKARNGDVCVVGQVYPNSGFDVVVTYVGGQAPWSSTKGGYSRLSDFGTDERLSTGETRFSQPPKLQTVEHKYQVGDVIVDVNWGGEITIDSIELGHNDVPMYRHGVQSDRVAHFDSPRNFRLKAKPEPKPYATYAVTITPKYASGVYSEILAKQIAERIDGYFYGDVTVEAVATNREGRKYRSTAERTGGDVRTTFHGC